MIYYDYSKLEGRIKEKFGTQRKFAIAMNLSERSMSLKLNGINNFKQSEIRLACELLCIPAYEIGEYFFNYNGQNN